MKFNIKSLLRNTTVLYIVFGSALLNFFTYILHHQYDAVVAFLVFGIITRYLFSKNMIVVLLVSMLITNTMMSLSYFKGKIVEGMAAAKADPKTKDGKKNAKKPKKGEEPKTHESFESRLDQGDLANNNEVMGDDEVDDIMAGQKIPKVDYASTLESAYDNLDKLLGSDAIRSMSEDTQRLADKQKKLMGNIQKLEPMMNKAGDMLKSLDMGKMGDMLKGLEGKMGMFGSNVSPVGEEEE
jgi:hypothetical protein